MLVSVRHPVPLRHVPRGKRSPVDAVLRVETHANVTEIPEGAMPRLGNRADVAPELFVGEGGLWTRLTRKVPVRGKPFHPRTVSVGRDEFLAWLTSPSQQPDVDVGYVGHIHRPAAPAEGIWHDLRGTPLQATWHVAVPPGRGTTYATWREESSGGEAFEVDRVQVDGRLGAGIRLQAFLDRDLRLCGDGVYLRAPLLARSALAAMATLTAARVIDPAQAPLLRPDLAKRYYAYGQMRMRDGPKSLDRIDAFLRRIPPGSLDPLADGTHAANHLCRFACAIADHVASRGSPWPVDDGLRSLGLLARIGAIGPDDAEAATRSALAYLDGLGVALKEDRALGQAARPPLFGQDKRLELVRREILPRLMAGPEPTPEDASALSGLAV